MIFRYYRFKEYRFQSYKWFGARNYLEKLNLKINKVIWTISRLFKQNKYSCFDDVMNVVYLTKQVHVFWWRQTRSSKHHGHPPPTVSRSRKEEGSGLYLFIVYYTLEHVWYLRGDPPTSSSVKYFVFVIVANRLMPSISVMFLSVPHFRLVYLSLCTALLVVSKHALKE